VDYGSKDSPIFGKKGGLPCVLVKGMTHVVNGVMEYSNLEEDGKDLQMVEVKRPRIYGPTRKNLRRVPNSKKRIMIKSLKTNTFDTMPYASKGLKSPFQTYKKDPNSNVDASPLNSESDQIDEHIERFAEIIVVDS
jgi:hypothetical protein